LARISGDVLEEHVAAGAEALARAFRIESAADLGRLLENPPPGAAPDALKRLRHMYEAGAWVILESAIADLPADLRWLYESGAVTIEQLAVLHGELSVTSVADLAAAVEEQAIRTIPGLDESIEYSVGAALTDIRRAIPRSPLGLAFGFAEPILSEL